MASSNKKTRLAKGQNTFKYFEIYSKFENHYVNIYYDELELKKGNRGPCKALFLDLSVDIHEMKFKRDVFLFILITCSVWIAINHLKYFMFELVLKFYVLPGQQQTLSIW